ncbi:MAG TPA: cation:proton antiporter [Kofleriaceae bacterium]|nr:cation:proton antiporter [Kofleriaceae bacterium]
MRLLLLVVLALLMQAAREFAPADLVGSGPAGVTLSCGFLLLTAVLAGSLVAQIGLPRITAYLLAGAFVGPEVLDLVSLEMVEGLSLFRGLAVPFIALLAGAELHVASMVGGLRGSIALTVVTVATSIAVIAGVAFGARDLFPFLDGLGTTDAVLLSLVVALPLAATSPSMAIALRDDAGAEGPLIRAVMAHVVLTSLLLFALTAIAVPAVSAVRAEPGDALRVGGKLAWTLFGSLAFGVGAGLGFAAFLRKLRAGGTLFAVGLSFAAAELGPRIGLDPLALALAAGIFLRNGTDLGPRVLADMQPITLPVYVAFFSIAGASLPLDSFSAVGAGALVLFAARALALNLGWRLGAGLTGAPAPVRRYGGIGLLPQADLALALAALGAATFADPAALSVIAAVIALDALLGPILFRIALVKSGEAGRRDPRAATAPPPDRPGERD